MATNQDQQAARARREAAHPASGAHARGNRQLQVLAGVVLAALLVVVLVVILGGGKSAGPPGGGAELGAPEAVEQGEVAGLAATAKLLDGIPQSGLRLGARDAPAEIIEFVDLQCPFCQASQLDDAPKVITELVRTGKASLRLAPLAFLGEDSVAGQSTLLRLAAENRAFQFANLWFWNQGNEGTGYATPAYLANLAKAAGGSAEAAEPRVADGAEAKVAAQTEALAKELLPGGPSTPTFAVGARGAELSTFKVFEPGTTPEQLAEAVAAVG